LLFPTAFLKALILRLVIGIELLEYYPIHHYLRENLFSQVIPS
jgi:hypothetical protein